MYVYHMVPNLLQPFFYGWTKSDTFGALSLPEMAAQKSASLLLHLRLTRGLSYNTGY